MAKSDRQPPVTLESVQLLFRNFSGKKGMYNAEGQRSFAVKLTPEWGEELTKRGWNVKYLKPNEDEEFGPPYISVKVNFEGPRPPKIFMISSSTGRKTQLGVDEVELLDYVDILNVDLILNPNNYDFNGKSGISVYLDMLYVTIIENALDVKYDNMDIATVEGPLMQPGTGPDPEPPRV